MISTSNSQINECIEFTGEILFRRKLGKKLCFITVFDKDNNIQRECLILNSEIIAQIVMGDVVTIKGYNDKYQDKIRFQATEVEWISRGSRENLINGKRKEFFSKQQSYQYSLCSFIKKGLKCPNSLCEFRHEINETEAKRIKCLKESKLKAYEDNHHGDPLNKDSKNKKIQRNSLFADFLVNTFGLENLKKGIVLDIAGGKGLTSLYLMSKYQIKCIIVDPRGTTIQKKYKKMMKKQDITLDERKEMFTLETCEDMIKDCSLVIGMHPDEATESIVDVAIKHKINFAVVPCCVFHSKFSDRKLKNGGEVVEYNELIEYLLEKEENIQIDFLNIEGRNKVLYKKY